MSTAPTHAPRSGEHLATTAPPGGGRARALALGPGAALLAWLAVLVVLNITVHPVVAAATWAGLAVLGWVSARRRLVLLSLVVGVGMLLVVPGVQFADGSWRFTLGTGTGWLPDPTPQGWLLGACSLLRVPAQVLAAALAMLVPAELLLAAVARLSPRSALLAGLAARLHPLLGRDTALVRDELESRGHRFAAPAPLGERLRAWAATWNAMVGGACDRAFATAAALEVRGYGAAKPTSGALVDPRLAGGARRVAALDRALVVLAIAFVGGAVWARSTGQLAPPVIGVFSGVHEPVRPAALLLAAVGLAIGLLPALDLRRAARATHPAAARIARHAEKTRGGSGLERATSPAAARIARHAEKTRGGSGLERATSPAAARIARHADKTRGGSGLERATSPAAARIARHAEKTRGGRGGVVMRGVTMRHAVAAPGAAPALDVVELDVEPGSFVVLTGSSGGGKSTLLDLLTGVAPHTTGGAATGTITISGREVAGVRSAGRAGLVSAVFQDPERQVVVGTVAEEVAFGLRHAGLPLAEVERRTVEALAALGCLHLARRDCATLSGGELQRVLLAAALAAESDLLVLDEPTSQLDAPSEAQFWSAVRRMQLERGTTVIASEHRIDHVRALCDRVVVLEGGRVVLDVPVSAADSIDDALGGSPWQGLAPAPVLPGAAPRLWLAGVTVRLPGAPGGAAGPSIVRSFDLAAPPGSVITLEGPNGVGKSTLLRALRGLHPHEGSVVVDGRLRTDVATSAPSLAWVSQQAGPVLDARTVEAQAADAARRHGWGEQPALRALVDAGLADRAASHPSELSVGERQRLALIASTSHRPAVWLLDEPTRGMDRRARRWLALQVLAHARAGGVAVIATHDPALAAALATHRLLLARDTPPQLVGVARGPDGLPLASPVAPASGSVLQPTSASPAPPIAPTTPGVPG